MRWSKVFFLAGLVAFLIGCSTTNDVVGRGPVQKRKYRSGWHLDFARSSARGTASERKKHATVEPEPVTELPVANSSLIDQPLASKVATNASEPVASVLPSIPLDTKRLDPVPLEEQFVQTPPSPAQDTSPAGEEDGPRYWNRMALVSGVFLVLSFLVIALSGGGGLLGYLLFFSFLTGVIGLILTIKHKEKGKGIAIAAIAFPVILIALVLAALNEVF